MLIESQISDAYRAAMHGGCFAQCTSGDILSHWCYHKWQRHLQVQVYLMLMVLL